MYISIYIFGKKISTKLVLLKLRVIFLLLLAANDGNLIYDLVG